ncbi:MAG: hypothetical protein ACRDBO_14895 [Lachnospiraceae bacterium]
MIKRFKNPLFYTTLLALASTCMITGCKSNYEKINVSGSQSHQEETMTDTSAVESGVSVQETSTANSSADDTDAEGTAGSDKGNSSSVQNISSKMNTYKSGNISIQYPSVIHLKDQSKTTAIDNLIKNNALSVIQAYGIDSAKDKLEITCKVLSADSNRITITYSGYLNTAGSAHPFNLFYSNTIDVAKADNIGFSKYADPYTMAGYVMSNDCRFSDKTPQQTEEIRSYLHTEGSLESYTQIFNQADFPYDSDFPSSFSYEHEGTIYFTIPVTPALGDYVIVVYTPDTK